MRSTCLANHCDISLLGQCSCELTYDVYITCNYECINMMHAGLAEESFFMRTLLDQWGVQHQSHWCEEYKDFLNTRIYKAYTKSHREATYSWLSNCMQQIVNGVAEARGLPQDQVCNICIHPHL